MGHIKYLWKVNWCNDFHLKTSLLYGCSTGADPTADLTTLWSAEKVGGQGLKSTKKAGNLWVGFTSPN